MQIIKEHEELHFKGEGAEESHEEERVVFIPKVCGLRHCFVFSKNIT